MIFVSTSCLKREYIKQSVIDLADAGLKNIELSGGTTLYDGWDQDLLELKEKYSLNYRCHNYFPPPERNFVLNLASSSTDTVSMSMETIKKSIDFSKRFGGKDYGFHAGFFIDIEASEIGKTIKRKKILPREESIARFISRYNELKDYAGPDFNLYVENNVYSKSNAEQFNGENILMLTNSKSYFELRESLDFKLLLDIAHLKVSCQTLGLDFQEEMKKLMKESTYLHFSDNDSFHDQNKRIEKDSELYHFLSEFEFQDKTITLEVYEGLDVILETVDTVRQLIC